MSKIPNSDRSNSIASKPELNSPELIDAWVGQNVRARRRQCGHEQVELAQAIGVSYQQLQKYEKAINRITPSRLFKAAVFLKTPVDWFFKEPADFAAEIEKLCTTGKQFSISEGQTFLRAIDSIEDPNIAQDLRSLVISLSKYC